MTQQKVKIERKKSTSSEHIHDDHSRKFENSLRIHVVDTYVGIRKIKYHVIDPKENIFSEIMQQAPWTT